MRGEIKRTHQIGVACGMNLEMDHHEDVCPCPSIPNNKEIVLK